LENYASRYILFVKLLHNILSITQQTFVRISSVSGIYGNIYAEVLTNLKA